MPEAHITPETIPTKQLDGVHINDKVMVTGADNVTKVVYGIAIIDVIASCTSAADAEIKTVQISNYTESEIPPGTKLHITFTYANTYGNASTTNPKLQLKNSNNENIGSPLNICDSRGHIAGANCWKAGDEMDFLVVGNKAKIQNSDIRWQDSSSSVLSDGSAVYNKQSVDNQINGALAKLETITFSSNFPKVLASKNNKIIDFYGPIEDLTTTTTLEYFTTFKPCITWVMFPIYSTSTPYAPIGSIWINSSGRIMIYKPANITSVYISGSYILA